MINYKDLNILKCMDLWLRSTKCIHTIQNCFGNFNVIIIEFFYQIQILVCDSNFFETNTNDIV
jgi:hypothetical protein